MNLQDKLLEATIAEIEQEYYTTPKNSWRQRRFRYNRISEK